MSTPDIRVMQSLQVRLVMTEFSGQVHPYFAHVFRGSSDVD